ncbi:VOC family protein [Hydrocarboniphaga sp.]|uniref:VOC family protein n=1 Tax=Hydrocarboniphaga sp. TaxID=2033016 RepID=UPI00345401FC
MSKIQALAYVVVESSNLQAWRHYAEQVLGMAAIDAPDGSLLLRMDERDFRIAIVPGAQDRYRASGLLAVDQPAFDAAVAELKAAGIAVEAGSIETILARRVKDLANFIDPAGNRHELVWGYTGGSAAFASKLGVTFKTGDYGVGHTVLPAIPFEPELALFKDALGMGLSDVFNFQMAPDAPVIRIYFLHAASGRHHSVALAEMPNPAGCVHMMVEVEKLTDVGRAYERMRAHGVKEMATMGEHENDRMTSFYMMTPGNFAIEYGYGGLIIEPESWQTTHTKQVSIWGHDFSVGFR